MRPEFSINLSDPFPHLAQAPIGEAVIHWRARSEKTMSRDELLDALRPKLPDYPIVRSQLELRTQFGPDGSTQAQRTQWLGFRLESEDGRYIAQFLRDGFVFSRITPYENWDRFVAEARRLWQIHLEFAEPTEIERLGVRFINRIVPVELDKLGEILRLPPQSPSAFALSIGEFLHRDSYSVPGYPYKVNIVQTTQPSAPAEPEALSLILDIDVFTTQLIALDDECLDTRLREMRWLKNRAFFSTLTDNKISEFK